MGCSAGQYIESISSSGIPTCRSAASLISNITCASGQFIYQHSNGVFGCRYQDDRNVYGKSCPNGQALRGFDLNGSAICSTDINVSKSFEVSFASIRSMTGNPSFSCNYMVSNWDLPGISGCSRWCIQNSFGGGLMTECNQGASMTRCLCVP